MLEQLDRNARLKLLRVVTAVAWVDGEVHPREREFAERLIERLELPDDEREVALGYLDEPPRPHELDASKLNRNLRLELLGFAREMARADGDVGDQEADLIEALEAVLGA